MQKSRDTLLSARLILLRVLDEQTQVRLAHLPILHGEHQIPQAGALDQLLDQLMRRAGGGDHAQLRKGIQKLLAKLLAGLFLHSLFLLQGVPHLPVPGLILSGPLYRGGGSLFMPGLFAVSLLLAGSAWCSHLCYLGVWDARAADAGPRSGRGVPALWRKMRWGLLAVSLLLPLGLRLAGLPWPWALVLALALGLALLPCALWLSRKLGIPVYCCGICPLGMTANLLARLSPWRLRRNGHCTGCGACARVCRYGALRLDGDGRVAGPDWRCTLCRDCMSVCRHRALEIRCCGRGGAWVEQALLCSLSVLHTLFLFMGRV